MRLLSPAEAADIHHGEGRPFLHLLCQGVNECHLGVRLELPAGEVFLLTRVAGADVVSAPELSAAFENFIGVRAPGRRT